MKRIRKLTSLTDVAAQLIQEARQPLQEVLEDEFKPQWIFGSQIGAHIDGVRVEGGVLHIWIRDPTWRKELKRSQSMLLHKAQAYDASLKRIKIHAEDAQK